MQRPNDITAREHGVSVSGLSALFDHHAVGFSMRGGFGNWLVSDLTIHPTGRRTVDQLESWDNDMPTLM